MIDLGGMPVLVRGAGDVGSAVSVSLYRAGYAVTLHEKPPPATPRRGTVRLRRIAEGVLRATACARVPA